MGASGVGGGARELWGGLGVIHLAEEGFEILGLAEVAVDAGETDVGYFVDLFEGVHDEFADLGGGDVGVAGGFELADDAVDDAVDTVGGERALADGDVDGAGEFFGVEGDAAAVGFDDGEFAELDALDGGEALAATGAETA